jgi:hypothetical protein
MNTTIHDAYCLFNDNANEKISESSFRKLLKKLKYIKKAKKHTDKCELCVCGKNIEKKIKVLNSTLSNRKVGGRYKERLEKELKSNTELLNNYKKHKDDAAHQRAAMKLQIEQLKNNEVVIIFDFKANIVIDQDPEYELSRDFYQNVQRTCFGAVVYYKNGSTVKKHFYDFFSEYMIHNSYFTTKALEKLFQCNLFTKKAFENVYFWMDNGPHFRTKELFRYFVSLKERKIFKNISWDYFVEHHGKSCCDRRFSQISAMYKKYINDPNNDKVRSTLELVKCIRSMSQENLKKKINKISKKFINNSTQILLKVFKKPSTYEIVKINNFKFGYYSFKLNYNSKEKVINASFLSNENTSKIFPINIVSIKTKEKSLSAVRVQTEEENEKVLRRLSSIYKLRENFTKKKSQNNNEIIEVENELSVIEIPENQENQQSALELTDTQTSGRPLRQKVLQSVSIRKSIESTQVKYPDNATTRTPRKRKREESEISNKKQKNNTIINNNTNTIINPPKYFYPENATDRLPNSKKRKRQTNNNKNKKSKIDNNNLILASVSTAIRDEISTFAAKNPTIISNEDEVFHQVVEQLGNILLSS